MDVEHDSSDDEEHNSVDMESSILKDDEEHGSVDVESSITKDDEEHGYMDVGSSAISCKDKDCEFIVSGKLKRSKINQRLQAHRNKHHPMGSSISNDSTSQEEILMATSPAATLGEMVFEKEKNETDIQFHGGAWAL